MVSRKLSSKILSFALLGLLLTASSFRTVNASSSNTSGFEVINVAWGTANNSTSASPGDSNIPLTVTLDYIFPNTATSIQGLLDLPQGFSLYNGSTVDYSSISQTTPTDTILGLTFDSIYVASDLSLGSYTFTLNLSWAASGYSYILNQTSTISISVEGTPELSFTSPSNSLTPGEVNDVLLTVGNDGTGTASDISVSVSSQIAGILGSIPEIQNMSAGANYSYTVQIYLPKSASGSVIPLAISATYKDPYGDARSAAATLDFYGSSLNEPSLDYAVNQHTLSPGEVNNVTVTLTNTGDGTAADVITAISGSTQSVTSVSDFPKVLTLDPGSSYSATLSIYVSNSAASSPVTLTFSASYVDSYGNSGTATQSEGFEVAAASSTTANTSLSITTLGNSVTAGNVSQVSFLITNTGNTMVYSPTFTISVPDPLVVAANSTFSSTTSIAPGANQVFVAYLTASPGSTAGIYSGNIQISFTDEYGTVHNQSYSVAISLSGSIELVVQNEAFSQNATGITITGSLLNEGSASAYYASVSGLLNNSAGSPDYVGEIDPNSPVPFTISVPYQAGANSVQGSITILLQYKNSLGEELNSSSSETTALKSMSEILSSNPTTAPKTSNQNGFGGLTLVQLALLLTIALVAVGTGVFAALRRRQNRRQVEKVSDSPQVA